MASTRRSSNWVGQHYQKRMQNRFSQYEPLSGHPCGEGTQSSPRTFLGKHISHLIIFTVRCGTRRAGTPALSMGKRGQSWRWSCSWTFQEGLQAFVSSKCSCNPGRVHSYPLWTPDDHPRARPEHVPMACFSYQTNQAEHPHQESFLIWQCGSLIFVHINK